MAKHRLPHGWNHQPDIVIINGLGDVIRTDNVRLPEVIAESSRKVQPGRLWDRMKEEK